MNVVAKEFRFTESHQLANVTNFGVAKDIASS